MVAFFVKMNAKIGFAPLFCLLQMSLPAQSLDLLQIAGGPGEETFLAVAEGSGGSVYVSGAYTQPFEWAGFSISSTGDTDIFLARLDETGKPLWVLPGGSIDTDEAHALASRPDGSACWGGAFWEELQAGDWIAEAPGGGKALFLLSVNENGAPQWGEVLYGVGAKGLNELASDPLGNVYATGYFGKTLVVGDTILETQDGIDGFVAKWSADGAFQWALRLGGSGEVRSECLAVRNASQVFLGGRFTGSISMAGGAIQTNTPDNDGFVAALSAETGEPLWLRKAGAQYEDAVTSLAVNDDGQLFALGTFLGVLQVAEGWNIQTAGFNTNFFLIRYHALDGTPAWAQSLGNGTDEQGLSMAIRNGGPVVAGLFQNSLTLGDQTITGKNGGLSAFAAGFRPEGDLRWLVGFPAKNFVIPESVAVSDGGAVWIAGGFSGEAWLNGEPVNANGFFDAWIGRLEDDATGIAEPARLAFSGKVFPNPTAGPLFIDNIPAGTEYRLFSPTGALLQTGACGEGIDLSSFPTGIYLLQLLDPLTGDAEVFSVKKN